VLDPDYVVFAEIRASLYLYQLKVDFAGVGEAMYATEREIDRLVLTEHRYDAVYCHLRRAANDDPMFGSMVVFLQAELFPGFDEEAFHLKALAAENRRITAPGAIGRAVDLGQIGSVFVRPQSLHHAADLLRLG